MAAAIACSALGMAVHTVTEFGYSGLWALDTGMLPVVGVQVLLFLAWWRAPGARPVAARALVVTAVLQLVGGAIISVLPLPILPFQPEQSVGHYLSHLFLGIAQLPLLVLPRRLLGARPSGRVRDPVQQALEETT
jgi:hypothetical protein